MSRDEKLMKAASEGDRAALEELIGMYYGDILQYCRWHTAGRAAAEDAAQETFLKFIRYFDSYIHRGKLRAFLYKIAACCCADQYRRAGDREALFEELPEGHVSVRDVFEDADAALAFEQMTAALPGELREVVLLRYGQELTLREIAEITETPLRTVQSRLRAALKRLRKEMENENEKSRSGK